MHDTILTKIILPSTVMLETSATMVNIPSSGGMFGVLPRHSKLISDIDIGVVTIFSGNKEQKYFTYGGVAQVIGLELNIISEFVADLKTTDKSEITKQISKLKLDLDNESENSLERSIISDKIEKHQKLLQFI